MALFMDTEEDPVMTDKILRERISGEAMANFYKKNAQGRVREAHADETHAVFKVVQSDPSVLLTIESSIETDKNAGIKIARIKRHELDEFVNRQDVILEMQFGGESSTDSSNIRAPRLRAISMLSLRVVADGGISRASGVTVESEGEEFKFTWK